MPLVDTTGSIICRMHVESLSKISKSLFTVLKKDIKQERLNLSPGYKEVFHSWRAFTPQGHMEFVCDNCIHVPK